MYKFASGLFASYHPSLTGATFFSGAKMLWQPLNLTSVCPAHTHLTACSLFGYVYLNLVTQLYGDSVDRRIQEYLSKEKELWQENQNEEYDFIVVGAGSAGCVVANRLTENRKWKVLLLEAGEEQPDVTLVPSLSVTLLGSSIDWQYSTEPDGKSCLARPGGRCDWPRGKVMGGSSTINSMAYVRGNRLDYDNWAALGNAGWSYEDVLPFFKKSERNMNIEGHNRKYHGIDGEQGVSRFPYIDLPSIMLTEAFHEAGLPINDFNGAVQKGTQQSQDTAFDGQRASTNNAFIQPIRYSRKNLTVRPKSEVIKILINEHKKAYGVKYVRDGVIHTAIAKKEVIVSAGAINSPKLLLLSGIGPRKQLEYLGIPVIEDLAVGENLHDHVTFNGIIVALNKTVTTVPKQDILRHVKDHAYAKYKAGPLSGNGPVSSVAFIKTEKDLPAPDIQIQVDHVKWQEYIQDPSNYDRITIFPTAFYDGLLPRTMNLVPKSRGRLVLNATDPHGPPLLYANYFGDPTDLIPIIKGVRFLLTLENTEAFKANGAYFVKTPVGVCSQYEWGTDDYTACMARSYTSTPYHPVGTCKMGPKWDPNAVVDPRLRVYGLDGLRVIDSSIMPVVPRGNTNAPSIMVGERGVDFVYKYWKNRERA